MAGSTDLTSLGEPSEEITPLFRTIESVSGSEGRVYFLEKRLLGKGSFGFVYTALEQSKRELVAIKEVSLSQVFSAAWREDKVLRRLQKGHPHIVRLIDVVEHGHRLLMVMERLEQSLEAVRGCAGKIDVVNCRSYFRQIVDGLRFLHSEGVVHGDIKPSNVMLASDRKVKIVDFGLTVQPCFSDEGSTMSHCWRGTPLFRPPEANRERLLTAYWDIWSFGIMAVILVSGKSPKPYRGLERGLECTMMLRIDEVSPEDLLPCLEEMGGFEDFPKLSVALRDMLRQCLQWEPTGRPLCDILLRHPFFTGSGTSSVNCSDSMPGSACGIIPSRNRSIMGAIDAPEKPEVVALTKMNEALEEKMAADSVLLQPPYLPLVTMGVSQVKGDKGKIYHLSPELLGRGSFGVVYLSVEDATG
eukprot:RCo015687